MCGAVGCCGPRPRRLLFFCWEVPTQWGPGGSEKMMTVITLIDIFLSTFTFAIDCEGFSVFSPIDSLLDSRFLHQVPEDITAGWDDSGFYRPWCEINKVDVVVPFNLLHYISLPINPLRFSFVDEELMDKGLPGAQNRIRYVT